MDQFEFPKIYSDHKEMVWRLTSRYVSRDADKEDLFQEIFLKVHKALPGFRGDSGIGTWIFRIAVNTSINYSKKQRRGKKILEVFMMFRQEEAVEGKIPDDSLFGPLNKLNSQQRMILLLSDVEENKLEEIANTLNIPLGTVKSNLHRAREIVKKELKQNERPE
ncbi:MAG: sigma-70 family RNA polymerase sigma factor [Candidatus Saganbacteria bacterium]|nr:sigma-70 family RNA polymerase sigma factor [Candidatus Saganbacteria bacterium]